MKIKSIELTHLDVPFTAHTNLHMKYWLPHWRIVQICKLTMDNGIVGFGETIPNYTWSKVPDDIKERVVGRQAGRRRDPVGHEHRRQRGEAAAHRAHGGREDARDDQPSHGR